ncbi:hypothetical protein EV426DRAFT_627544 [Tirmania nivea]|nr:hypothetical protein EV426DRAFT_627544 [Tirmania nivea]
MTLSRAGVEFIVLLCLGRSCSFVSIQEKLIYLNGRVRMAMSTSRLAKCHPLCELMAALAVSLKRLGRHKTTMTPLEQLIAAMEKLVKEEEERSKDEPQVGEKLVKEEEERSKDEPVGLEHKIRELTKTYQPLDMEEWKKMRLEQAHQILDEEIEELELKRRMDRVYKMQQLLGLELQEREKQRRLDAADRILDREIAELAVKGVKSRLQREQEA